MYEIKEKKANQMKSNEFNSNIFDLMLSVVEVFICNVRTYVQRNEVIKKQEIKSRAKM